MENQNKSSSSWDYESELIVKVKETNEMGNSLFYLVSASIVSSKILPRGTTYTYIHWVWTSIP